MKAKQNKYIDLNQFPHNQQNKIIWKDCIGLTVEFYYNNKQHKIKILERINKDYFKILLDDIVIEKAHTSKITGLMFDNLLYEPDYFYNIGDVINEKIEIIERLQIQRKTAKGKGSVKCKGYLCRCLIDGYEFTIEEFDLKNGHGCPVCVSHIIVKGINDIGTTHPHLVKYFVNEQNAYLYSYSSEKRIKVKCPICGYVKEKRIADLSKYGIACDRCDDGISYPNKFAHELFRQLSKQYKEYVSEFSPEWASKYRYDNYVKLPDNTEIIVEMDGGFHYCSNEKFASKTDEEKDVLANNHNIIMVRVNCSYDKIEHRYDYIKNNVIKSLENYFDLSTINWDLCNEVGISNRLIDVLSFYENNPKLGLLEIANHFNISMPTLYGYLYTGEELGLCKYIRNDPNRVKNSKPIAMYDSNMKLIGIYKSGKQIADLFSELKFSHRQIRSCANNNKTYKNYIFKFATYEEYQQYC